MSRRMPAGECAGRKGRPGDGQGLDGLGRRMACGRNSRERPLTWLIPGVSAYSSLSDLLTDAVGRGAKSFALCEMIARRVAWHLQNRWNFGHLFALASLASTSRDGPAPKQWLLGGSSPRSMISTSAQLHVLIEYLQHHFFPSLLHSVLDMDRACNGNTRVSLALPYQ